MSDKNNESSLSELFKTIIDQEACKGEYIL